MVELKTDEDEATLLGNTTLRLLGVNIKSKEECKRLRNDLEMLRSPQMQEHFLETVQKLRERNPRMNLGEAERIAKMLQLEAVYTRLEGTGHPYQTWHLFRGFVTRASSSARRSGVEDGDQEVHVDIKHYMDTMLGVASRKKKRVVRRKTESQGMKMSAPSK
jgi:hypothetical protein